MKKIINVLTCILMSIALINVSSVSVNAEDTASTIISKIKTVNTLYDNGEANLTDSDVVTINGVDYYVLQVDSTNNKAELMAKNIYDVRFDDGGHTCTCTNGAHDASNTDCVMNYVGTNSSYTDKTYNYAYSSLQKWINETFYNAKLKDSVISNVIVPTNVIAYKYVWKDASSSFELDQISTLSNQKVFAIDAQEAKTNASHFCWDDSNTYLKNLDGTSTSTTAINFWSTSGHLSNGMSYSVGVQYYGGYTSGLVGHTSIGARPCFWVDLTEPSSNTNTPTSSNTSGTTDTTTQTTVNETKTYTAPNTCGD